MDMTCLRAKIWHSWCVRVGTSYTRDTHIHRETMGLEGGVPHWLLKAEIMEGGWWIDEIQVSNFRFVPQIIGGSILLLLSKIAPTHGSGAQDVVGIAVADECRHLLVCSAMCPRWASAVSFGRFCILIVLLYLFLQISGRHGATALFKSMAQLVEGKIWDRPSKITQNNLNWELRSSYGANKPSPWKPSFPHEYSGIHHMYILYY